MKKALRIVSVIALALAMAVSCSSGNGRVIPRGKLSKIYAEMLLMDQWINCHQGYNRMADTSFVYRPILEKYGYDEADYRRSVDKYIQDPERYSRILKNTADVLERRQKELQALSERLNNTERPTFDHCGKPDSLYYLAGMRNPTNFVDFGGITMYVDSIPGTSWRFDPASGFDTLFCGPRIIIIERDTIATRIDSLATVCDSLALRDSLQVVALEEEEKAETDKKPALPKDIARMEL